MADKCPLGEDCDLTLAYMMGAEKAKDSIVVLRRENKRLRAALELFACYCTAKHLCAQPDNCVNYIARAALEEK